MLYKLKGVSFKKDLERELLLNLDYYITVDSKLNWELVQMYIDRWLELKERK